MAIVDGGAARLRDGNMGRLEALPTFLPGTAPTVRRSSLLSGRDLDIRNQFSHWATRRRRTRRSARASGIRSTDPVLLLALPWFAAGGDAGLLAFNVAQLSILAALVVARASPATAGGLGRHASHSPSPRCRATPPTTGP